MELYRSGHNEHDWKSCCRDERHEGSNPSNSARKKASFLRVLFLCTILRGFEHECRSRLEGFEGCRCRWLVRTWFCFAPFDFYKIKYTHANLFFLFAKGHAMKAVNCSPLLPTFCEFVIFEKVAATQ